MTEITLTSIIFLTLSSVIWLIWFYLFRNQAEITPKNRKKKSHSLENYLDDIEERYAQTNDQLEAYRQENRELKGKLFQEKNRLMTLNDRLKDLQGRKFVFNSEKIIDELQYELRTKEKRINKLMAKLAPTPINEKR